VWNSLYFFHGTGTDVLTAHKPEQELNERGGVILGEMQRTPMPVAIGDAVTVFLVCLL
jgi:hypothetical protein